MSEPAQPRCLVCGGTGARVRYRITRFSILACTACDQVYLWPLPSEEEIRKLFSELYTTGEGSVPELRSYYGFCYRDEPSNPLVEQYERWLDRIEQHGAKGRLLDIGCGTGLFLSVARRRGWETFGVDDCEEATVHAREHFGLDVWVGDFADFPSEAGRFDAITMWDIIEHSRAPVELLKAVRAQLTPEGRVGISTPNQRSILDLVAGALYRLTAGRVTSPLEKFYIEQHFLYYSPATLEASLVRAGLDLVRLDHEQTDLRRLTLARPVRLGIQGLFLFARLTGLENRLFAVARCASAEPAPSS